MKNLFRKENKVNKVIALWLVFIMMLVPLVSHMGSKEGAKAANANTPMELETSFELVLTNTNSVEAKDLSGVGGNSAELAVTGITPITKNFYFDTSSNGMGVNLNTPNVTVSGDISYNSNDYSVSGYSITCSEESDDFLPAATGEINVVSNIAQTKTYNYYAKFELTNKSDSSDVISTCYVKVATYNFTKEDAFTTNPTWVDENGTGTDPNKWYKPSNVSAAGATTEFNGDGTHPEYLGVVKYAFAKYVDGKNTYSEYTSMTKGWTKAAEGVNLTNRSSGSYIGFIGYFGSDSDTEPMKVQSIGVVKVDLGNPSFVSAGNYSQGGYLYYCATNWSDFDPTNSNKYTEAVGTDKEILASDLSKYRYYVKFKDWDDESGISKVYIKQGSNPEEEATKVTINGSDYWYCEAKLLEDSDKIYAWATDVVGNTSKQGNGEEIPGKVKEFAPSYDLTWTYAGTPNYDMTTGTEIYVGPEKNLILDMDFSTMDKIGRVVVSADVSGNPVTIATINNEDSSTTKPYSFEETVDFFDELGVSTGRISNIKITVRKTDGSEMVSASVSSPVWYDGTEPVITYNPSDSWYTSVAAAKLDAYTVSSGDAVNDESNLESVVISIDGVSDTIDNIASSSEGGNIQFTGDSTSSAGTSVTIKATDSAGNATTKNYTVKIDTQAPTITDPVVASDNRALNGTTVGCEDSIKFTATDNIEIGKVVYVIEDPNGIEKEIVEDNIGVATFNASKKLKDDLGLTLDGQYTLTVYVYDLAGWAKYTSEATFEYDSSAPVMLNDTGFVIKVVDPNTSAVSYESAEIPGVHEISEDGQSFYIRSDDTNEYYYKVVVDDDSNIDVNRLNSEVLPEGLTLVTEADDPADSRYEFYIKVDTSKLKVDEGLSPSGIKVYDTFGNESEFTIHPNLYLVDATVRPRATLCYADGTAVDITDSSVVEDLANGTSEQYYVKIDVSSADPVTEVILADTTTEYIQSSDGTNKSDIVTLCNTYTDMLALPTGDNILIDEWFAKIKINGNTYTTSPLIELLYDKTNPVLDGVKSDIVWSNSKDISYSIVSGKNSSVESTLAKVVVNVTNSNADITMADLADGTKTSVAGTVSVPESKTVAGTNVKFTALDNAGNPYESPNYTFLVDKTAPKVDSLGVVINDAFIDTTKPTTGTPVILTGVSDNLTLAEVSIAVVYPDGATVKGQTFTYDANSALAEGTNGVQETLGYTLEAVNGVVPDGVYYATVTAKDKATNESITKEIYFIVDNTVPVVTAKVISGTTAGKAPLTAYDGTVYDNYYSSNVDVQLTYTEANKKDIVVTDNGTEVEPKWSINEYGQYVAVLTVSAEGGHNIVINGTDTAGAQAAPCSVSFYIDKQVPTITTVLNGGIVYTESMGKLKMTGDTGLSASISDAAEDPGDLNVQIIKAVPDQPVSAPAYVKTTARQFAFTDEADYTINLFAIDMAGNQGPARTVNFRVDKTAPQITISGVSGGGTSSSQATVSFVMKELFWADSTGTVTIYRKADDNSAETLYKTINYTPTAYETVVSETLTETGKYRIEFTASDWIGHQVETSQTFTIDRDAPELVLTAKQNSADSEDVVKNKQSLDVPVYIGVSVTDAFYLSKNVTMTGTYVNAEGTVSNLTFDGLVQSGNGTAFENIYTEDGTYTINVVTTDAAGNESSASIQFTIDNSDPVISELPAGWSGTITSFEYVDPLTLVSDMTDCEVHMYINGVEYDGSEELPDGAYTLVITAEDELGHIVETSTEFVIDSQAPVFIVTGVEKDQVKNETYQITVSLQLDEDELLYVKLNGEEQAIDPNTKTCTITVDKKGNYTLEMAAKDAAGNEASDKYEFKYGEDFNWWIIVIIALAVILLGFIIFIVAKKKKSE